MMKPRNERAGDYSRASSAASPGEESAGDDLLHLGAGDGAGDVELAREAPLEIRLPLSFGGERLDQTLAAVLSAYSRSRLQAWIRAGRVWVAGSVCVDVRHRVRGGEAVVLWPEDAPSDAEVRAEAIDFPIVFADETLIVIDKPAGLVVHPGSGNWSGTLQNALLHYAPALAGVPRAGIVHRLDKDTSGLLVVARTLAAHTDLVRQLQARSVRRQYLALVGGELVDNGSIDAPIGRHPRERVRMAVIDDGRHALTHYRVVEALRGATLVECTLETGRTHQIRVHMAHLGHPLLGDPLYGPRRSIVDFPRQALHAWRLGLVHPGSGAAMQWESPLPADIAQLLESMRAA